MSENITLKGLLLLCKRQIVTILSTFSFIVILAGILTIYVVPPKYEYSKQIMVGQLALEKGSNVYELPADNVQLIRSYMDIINSSTVLESVLKKLGLKRSVSSLNDQISLRNNENSQIITITVSDSSPVLAKKIAELTALHSKEMMKKFTNVNYIQILDQQKYVSKPLLVFPKPLLTTILSVFFGLFTGLCLAILKDGFDTTIKSEKDLEELLHVPLLGSLNTREIEQKGKKSSGTSKDFSGTPQKKIQSYAIFVRTSASTLFAFLDRFKGFYLTIIKNRFNATIKNEKDSETLLHLPSLDSLSKKEIEQGENKPSGTSEDFSGTLQKKIQNYAIFVRTLASMPSAFLDRFKGFYLIIIKNRFNATIKSERDLETLLHISSLGSLNEKMIEQMRKNPVGERGDFFGIPQKEIQSYYASVGTD